MARSKYGLNCGRGTPISGPAEPEGDQALGAHGRSAIRGGLLGGLQPGLAGDVEAPAQYDAELGLGRLAGVLDRLQKAALVDAAAGRASTGVTVSSA